MNRYFNTAEPMKRDKHYCIAPLTRFALDEILSLIHQEKYFILHAPPANRQNQRKPQLTIANRMYQEIIHWQLTNSAQAVIVQEDSWYLTEDGRQDMARKDKLFKKVKSFKNRKISIYGI